MWGSWFIVIIGLTAGLIVLLMSLVVGASPLFAVFAVILAVLAFGFIALARRGVKDAQDQAVGGEALRGRDASGAPITGEGGPPPPGR